MSRDQLLNNQSPWYCWHPPCRICYAALQHTVGQLHIITISRLICSGKEDGATCSSSTMLLPPKYMVTHTLPSHNIKFYYLIQLVNLFHTRVSFLSCQPLPVFLMIFTSLKTPRIICSMNVQTVKILKVRTKLLF